MGGNSFNLYNLLIMEGNFQIVIQRMGGNLQLIQFVIQRMGGNLQLI